MSCYVIKPVIKILTFIAKSSDGLNNNKCFFMLLQAIKLPLQCDMNCSRTAQLRNGITAFAAWCDNSCVHLHSKSTLKSPVINIHSHAGSSLSLNSVFCPLGWEIVQAMIFL